MMDFVYEFCIISHLSLRKIIAVFRIVNQRIHILSVAELENSFEAGEGPELEG